MTSAWSFIAAADVRRVLFDEEGSSPARHLKLITAERRKGDLLWVRYRVRGTR